MATPPVPMLNPNRAVDSEMKKLAAALGNLEAINICYPNTEEGKQLLAETQIEMRL